MRELEREPGEREAGIPCDGADPKGTFVILRPVSVESEVERARIRSRVDRILSPEANMVALARAVADRLLESDILTSAKEIKGAERCRGIWLVENKGSRH